MIYKKHRADRQRILKVVLSVSWEYWGLLGRACLMERVYCSLIICCPASGNADPEIFPGEEGVKNERANGAH